MGKSGRLVRIGIVGLGKVGTTFLKKLVEYDGNGVSILAVAEKNQSSPGINIARDSGIQVYDSEEKIIEMGEKIDVVFDLTGNKSVERNMRLSQVRSGNTHTVVVPIVMATLIWNLISEDDLNG